MNRAFITFGLPMARALILVFLAMLPLQFFSNEKDSLLALINNSQTHDTVKMGALIRLSGLYSLSNFDSSVYFGEQARKLALKKRAAFYYARACQTIGMTQLNYGNWKQCIIEHKNAAAFYQCLPGVLSYEARCYNNMGNGYKSWGKLKESLENYEKAKKLYEIAGDRKGIGGVINNIGNIHLGLGDPLKAREMFREAAVINTEMGNKNWLSINIMNIGITFFDKQQFDSAAWYFLQAKKLSEETGFKGIWSSVLVNLGNVNMELNKPDLAEKYFQEAIAYNQSIGNEHNNALLFSNIAANLKKKGEKARAYSFLDQSISLSEKYQDLYSLQSALRLKSEMKEEEKNFQDAHVFYKKYIATRDSLQNSDSRSKMNELEESFKEEKHRIEMEKLTRENQLKEVSAKKNMILFYSALGMSLLILIAAGIFLKKFINEKKAKKELSDKNQEIKIQKAIIEEKNKDISDSIAYAKQIQESLLPTENELGAYFSDSFIFFKPKDVVSGDFFWLGKSEDGLLVAVADCTGHGVPGALMSMIGIEKLNQSLSRKFDGPGKILSDLNKAIRKTLKQDGQWASRDGMDIGLIHWLNGGSSIRYSGANRPLWVIRNKQVLELPATKSAIGGTTSDEQVFEENTMDLTGGDILYLFSDGYADQFGGEKGKKLKYKKLREIILENAHLPMKAQKQVLEDTFEKWKGPLDQIDDILVMGIRI